MNAGKKSERLKEARKFWKPGKRLGKSVEPIFQGNKRKFTPNSEAFANKFAEIGQIPNFNVSAGGKKEDFPLSVPTKKNSWMNPHSGGEIDGKNFGTEFPPQVLQFDSTDRFGFSPPKTKLTFF